MRSRLLTGILASLLLCCSVRAGAALYVAPNGDDANPGTKAAPFATLEAARDTIRTMKHRPSGGVTVYLRGGDYFLKRTFELDERDSGTAHGPVVYRACKNESVHLIGGRLIDPATFKPVTDPGILQRVPAEAHGHVLEADLKTLGINDYGEHKQFGHALPVVPAPLELFFNDDVMPLAHYPNSGSITMGKVIDPGSVPRIKDYVNIRGGTFEYTDDRHARWAGVDDVWFQGTFHYGFADDKIKVEWINPETRQVKLATPHMYGLASGQPYQQYVALNLLEELDTPGEWYLDRKTGLLYFWPPTDIAQARIAVSILEDPIVAMEGVSYVTLQGLAIEVARGMGVYIERGQNNLIAGCTLRNLGTSAVFMGQGARQTFPHITHDDYEGVPVSREIGNLQGHIYKYTTWDRKAGKNHGVLSCDVYNTGCGGIYLSGGSKKDLVPGNCYVENCRIHDYQRRNKFLWAGINVDGCGNRIAHNEIFNADFQGIYAHGNDHIYEYNLIHHVALDSDDTSAWYLGRDPSDRGNVIRYNFFHHVGRPDRMVMGVYCDDATCGVTVYGNVFYKTATHGSVFSNAGHDIIVRNNVFVDTMGPAVWLNSWWRMAPSEVPEFFGENGIYRRRLTELLDIKKPPYSTRYPELSDWMDPIEDGKAYVGMLPRRNLMENNVIVNSPGKLRLDGERAQFEDSNNFETKDDPGFVDAANMNFQLRKDSAVYKKLPGFKKIPFDKIGLYRDKYRKTLTAADAP